MNEPEWLDSNLVLDFHTEQLALVGGADGLRDVGLPESALARPRNKFAYGETGLPALAAAYAAGTARNRPFVDGNKRAAFTALIVFLGMEATAMMYALAAGDVDEDGLARWIADRVGVG